MSFVHDKFDAHAFLKKNKKIFDAHAGHNYGAAIMDNPNFINDCLSPSRLCKKQR